MKLIVLACLLAVAFAAPRPDQNAETIAETRDDNDDGSYSWSFETSNGIKRSESGTPGSEGQINKNGDISFPLGDGQTLSITFVADENGFQPRISFSGGKRK